MVVTYRKKLLQVRALPGELQTLLSKGEASQSGGSFLAGPVSGESARKGPHSCACPGFLLVSAPDS